MARAPSEHLQPSPPPRPRRRARLAGLGAALAASALIAAGLAAWPSAARAEDAIGPASGTLVCGATEEHIPPSPPDTRCLPIAGFALSAVMVAADPHANVALLSAAGHGYIVRQGTLLGPDGGEITEITESAVVVSVPSPGGGEPVETVLVLEEARRAGGASGSGEAPSPSNPPGDAPGLPPAEQPAGPPSPPDPRSLPLGDFALGAVVVAADPDATSALLNAAGHSYIVHRGTLLGPDGGQVKEITAAGVVVSVPSPGGGGPTETVLVLGKPPAGAASGAGAANPPGEPSAKPPDGPPSDDAAEPTLPVED
jgi:Tfp pilus assembly protein PilP